MNFNKLNFNKLKGEARNKAIKDLNSYIDKLIYAGILGVADPSYDYILLINNKQISLIFKEYRIIYNIEKKFAVSSKPSTICECEPFASLINRIINKHLNNKGD